jgi:transposase
VLLETFIRKVLYLKAHRVTAVKVGPEQIVVEIDRLKSRALRCGVCRGSCRKVHQVEEARSWQDLSLRQLPMVLRYRPRRLRCARCGVHVEAVPWARFWARVTTTLGRAVAELAQHLSWQETARHFRLDWKSVASIVRRVVAYGLERRRRRPLHLLGIDEVSRRKGHHYLTVVYDLERRVLLWVGENRTEETLTRVQVVCLDMWQAYLNAVRHHAPNAQVLFDRFHLVQHLNRAVDEVRRQEWRRLSGREKTSFKRTRFLLLKNPWNLTTDERERLSTLVRWNSPIVRAYYLKEVFQLFWSYRQPARAEHHLRRWLHSAMRSRLQPFKELVCRLRAHLQGVLAWTRLRVSNGALEGMNNKIKLVSHRSFGFRTVENFTAAIYHCCAHLPLPEEC